jgi:CBS domain containing-hemolysin-like protein
MIPRTDIFAVPDSIDSDELKQQIAENRHTRIPVYDGSLDNVTGFLHIKDFMMCLMTGVSFDIATMKREILFVPASMKIVDLLLKMRLSSSHVAIVVDEYGGTDGLVTMEDLFEEIVGEIHDEHDDAGDQPEIRWVSDRTLEADARVDIDEVSQQLQLDLAASQPNDDFDTLGGLLFSHLGRIPAKGEVIEFDEGLKFEITSADPRRIRKVRIVKQA